MAFAYDEVFYRGYPRPQTHPDHLATLATLFGMNPPPVESCRVLELGCGDGANLLPMAFGLPGSHFVGLDLASLPIEKANALQEALGLTNVVFCRQDIMTAGPEMGSFDYIIAHGIYSWVPPPVRDKLLSVCKSHLAPNGVAFLSYNAYPGGHLRRMVREMMQFHTRHFSEAAEQVAQARALLKFLADSGPEPDPYRVFLDAELARVRRSEDAFLYHDDLAETSTPVYFHEFIEHARQHGLQYLAEADFFEMQDHAYPPAVREVLRQLADNNILLKEQYLDFIKCRRFRQTLLCHDDLRLRRNLQPEQMQRFYVASSAQATGSEPDLDSDAVVEFRTSRGASVSTNLPLAKAALFRLSGAWPQCVAFHQLLPAAADEQAVSLLGETLLGTYAAGVVELHVHAPQLALEPGERPVASPLARLQAQAESTVTNLRHNSVQLEDTLGRHLLLLLDGKRDRTALRHELAALIERGAAILHQDGQPVTDPQAAVALVNEQLEPNLYRLARLALLLA